jgi:hypothetical protein
MLEETRRFSSGVVLKGDGKLGTLLTANYSYINADLAGVYGATAPATPFARTDLNGAQRLGILTHPSVLSSHASAIDGNPVKRGKFVREQVLCGALKPPPDDIPPLSAVGEKPTLRQELEAHVSNPTCAGCHKDMDPLGFGLGNFDAIGRYHTMEGGQAIDTSGVITGLAGGDQAFADMPAMLRILGGSEDVARCVATQWLRFAYARPESDYDRPSFEIAYSAFAESEFDIRELMIALIKSRSFQYRTLPTGEVTQ